MIVVGLNAYHGDVSAALVRDGQLIAAVEEERFRRIKHCAGFPHRALASCLEMAGVAAADVDCFAISRDPRAHLWRKALFLATKRPKRTDRRPGEEPAEATIDSRYDRRIAGDRSAFGAATHDGGRASSGAPRERRLRQPVRRCGGLRNRRVRRFREHVVGRRRRQSRRGPRRRLLSALAGADVPGDHTASRVHEVRRRVQGDGSSPIRRAAVQEGDRAAGSRARARHVRARSVVLQPLVGRRRHDLGRWRADDRTRVHAEARRVAGAGAPAGGICRFPA